MLEAVDPLLDAEGADQLGLAGRVLVAAVGQQSLALEPEGLEPRRERLVIEAPPDATERIPLGGLPLGGRARLRLGSGTQPDGTRFRRGGPSRPGGEDQEQQAGDETRQTARQPSAGWLDLET